MKCKKSQGYHLLREESLWLFNIPNEDIFIYFITKRDLIDKYTLQCQEFSGFVWLCFELRKLSMMNSNSSNYLTWWIHWYIILLIKIIEWILKCTRSVSPILHSRTCESPLPFCPNSSNSSWNNWQHPFDPAVISKSFCISIEYIGSGAENALFN